MRIGTRASELALRQARFVEAALLASGIRSELVPFKTTGDKKLDQPLTEIGAKGLFTRELEVALAKHKIDCAVHSLKDLPTAPDPRLVIAAIPARLDPRVTISEGTADGVSPARRDRQGAIHRAGLRRAGRRADRVQHDER